MDIPKISETMVYVYELPEQLGDDYCFGGGRPISFRNVDWFQGFEGMTREDIETFVRPKVYVRPDKTYLILSPDNDMSFTFPGTAEPAEREQWVATGKVKNTVADKGGR